MDDLITNINCESDSIAHTGIINQIDDKHFFVKIITQKACSNCYSKGICSVSDLNDQIIEVPRKPNATFKIGDKVDVVMKKSLGSKAVFLGYVMPFLLLLLTLIITFNLSENEGLAGLSAVGILVPYYLTLYLVKDRLKSTFIFNIQKQPET
jgi:sigma-E factor negative regulatory protein RseC